MSDPGASRVRRDTIPDREGEAVHADAHAQRLDLRAVGQRLARDLYRVPGVLEVLPAHVEPYRSKVPSVVLTRRTDLIDAEVEISLARGFPPSGSSKAVADFLRAALHSSGVRVGEVHVRVAQKRR